MKLRYWLGVILAGLLLVTCGDDDESDPISIDIPEFADQAAIDDPIIQEYLATHFYNEDQFVNPPEGFDFEIRFDTIAGENATRTPLIDQVTTVTINRNETEQTIYVLTAREGVGEALNYTDSSLVTFQGAQLYRFDDVDLDGIPDFADVDAVDNVENEEPDTDGDGIIDTEDADNDGVAGTDAGVIDVDGDGIIDNTIGIFDGATTPVWFNLPGTVDGFQQGVEGFREGSGFIVNDDGTTTFNNDYGIGALFIPSGLGFFASPPPGSGVGLFSNIVFTFSVFERRVTDHDGDGIISIMEDIDGNNFLADDIDNTDGDILPNFVDQDDDGDGVRTRLEILLDDEGNLIGFIDTDGDGINNNLDDDDDGDGIDTIDEIIINMITNETTFPDGDGDGIPDYLDADS